MAYAIIRPPFELTFRHRPTKDLLAYREWFHKVLPERVAELMDAVKSTPGFEQWRANYEPDSLGPLGEWFRIEVAVRERTPQERTAIESGLTFSIEVPNWDLTERTFSLAMDVGMYFGQVALKNGAGTRWNQPLKNPRLADYGQPVIAGFGNVALNPVRIALTLAYAFAANEQPGNRLRAVYDVWARMAA